MRRPVRWIVGSLSTVAVLVGIAVWRAHSIANETIARHLVTYQEALVRIRSTLRSRPALVGPEEPGDASALVDDLHAALSSIPRADLSNLEEWDTDPSRARDPGREREVLGRAQPALDAMDGIWRRALAGSPSPGLGPSGIGSGAGVPRLQAVGKALSAAVRLARASGRIAETLRLGSDLLLVGQDAAREGTLMGALVGAGIETLGSGALERTLRETPVAAEVLERLAERLKALRETRPSIAPAWTLARTHLEGTLSDDALFGALPRGGPFVEGVSLRTFRSMYSTRIGRSNTLRSLELLPETLPPELAAQPDGAAAERTLAAHGCDTEDPVLSEWIRIWPVVLRKIRVRDTHASVLELAVAIARFEVDHHAWPASESDLVPRYLSAIPTSPFDPNGLRFDGQTAWSRGPDGDDDGRRPLSAPYEGVGDGDIVVQVKGHR